MSLRAFLDLDPEETPPNHSTLSRTRRRIDVETHREVFTWVLARLAEAGLVRGKTIGIDATTLEANAAMRSLVRRDTGEDYETFVKGLAKASGSGDTDPEGSGSVRPEAQEEDEQPGMGESTRPGGEDHEAQGRADPTGPQGGRGGGPGDGGGCGGDGAGGVGGRPDDEGHPPDGAGGSEGGRVGSRGPGSGDGPGIPQQRDGSGVEGTGIAGVSVGTGSGPAQLEGEEPEVPGAGLRQSETDPGAAGTTVAAAAERVGGAAVRAPVHHGRAAPDLRPGPRQRAQAIAAPRVRIQPGTADAAPDGGRDAPESAGSGPGASFFAFSGRKRAV